MNESNFNKIIFQEKKIDTLNINSLLLEDYNIIPSLQQQLAMKRTLL